ncbi:TetR/AcrR family transcriptional regulator [Halorientalis regularis]|jgi:AcrR family transcriptional regulator|uniref:DNA-binding transcriptional regulator, AcrR family n=1 Tax=Halorientalis regularis TaxID=660518 RepID=A0A1G7QQE5_9EURY|nr:TetR/AcrR family transcriptional regulator [Halorientalis regularis]SDF99850.1 DNA-binding transcriptional regulator, AcrR family [Halorientalis regularis]
MSETRDEIMEATYRALCTHGYADLTMQDIADETELSKAALHYHYDSKQELLESFLDFLYDEFTERVGDPEGGTAPERLHALVEKVLSPPAEDDDERVAFKTAILELKAQAPYDEGIRERLQRFDAFLHDEFEAVIADGTEAGTIRAAVDPDDAARFLVTALDGTSTKQVAVGQDPDCARRMLTAYIERTLTVDGENVAEVSPE